MKSNHFQTLNPVNLLMVPQKYSFSTYTNVGHFRVFHKTFRLFLPSFSQNILNLIYHSVLSSNTAELNPPFSIYKKFQFKFARTIFETLVSDLKNHYFYNQLHQSLHTRRDLSLYDYFSLITLTVRKFTMKRFYSCS